jgi:hypothetical protein
MAKNLFYKELHFKLNRGKKKQNLSFIFKNERKINQKMK